MIEAICEYFDYLNSERFIPAISVIRYTGLSGVVFVYET